MSNRRDIMKIKKVLQKKTVKVSDLLRVSDRNEGKHSVIEALDGAYEDSRKMTKVIIIAELDKGTVITHRAGWSNRELVYILDMAKFKALQEDSDENECEGDCDAEL
jgi:hypothetical protein